MNIVIVFTVILSDTSMLKKYQFLIRFSLQNNLIILVIHLYHRNGKESVNITMYLGYLVKSVTIV